MTSVVDTKPDEIETHGIYVAYWRLRKALKDIDTVAAQKKAGAATKMQRIARRALAPPNGDGDAR